MTCLSKCAESRYPCEIYNHFVDISNHRYMYLLNVVTFYTMTEMMIQNWVVYNVSLKLWHIWCRRDHEALSPVLDMTIGVTAIDFKFAESQVVIITELWHWRDTEGERYRVLNRQMTFSIIDWLILYFKNTQDKHVGLSGAAWTHNRACLNNDHDFIIWIGLYYW